MPSPLPRSLSLALVGGAVAAAALALWPRLASSDAPVQADRSTRNRPAAPPPSAPEIERREARLFTTLAWGSGPRALGHEIPGEGSPQGPMSFAVDAKGHLHALDTVNGRVLVLEGDGPGRSVPLPSDTIEDLDVTAEGGYLALDRHIAKCVHVLTPTGKERGRIELVGPEIPYAGLITALFARRDGVWVEVEHQKLVRVGDENGLPLVERSVVAGRFTADGKGTLMARRVPPTSVQIRAITPSLQATTLAQPSFALPVAHLTALEPLEQGGLVLGAILHRDRVESPYTTEEVRHLLVGIDARGVERWRAELPADEGPEENLRPVRLGRDGSLYGMIFRKTGVEFWKVTP